MEVDPTLPAGITGDATANKILWAFRHTPNEADPSFDEKWVWVEHDDGTISMWRETSSGWTNISFGGVAHEPLGIPYASYAQAISFHGKMYLAYRASVDRLHVWDGTNFRMTGLDGSDVTVADTVGAGAYPATTIYIRLRYIEKVGGVITRRSEPGAVYTFTPSGANDGIVVSPSFAGTNGATDTEIEGSTDNANFYRIVTSAGAAGAPITITTPVPANFSTFPLSDPLGSYDNIPTVQRLTVDDDRLVMGGSWAKVADTAQIIWTPRGSDPLPGPDERINSNTDPRIDLDHNHDSLDTAPEISQLTRPHSGNIVAFKRRGIYKVARTGNLVGAYEAIPFVPTRGAIAGSVIDGQDAEGNPVTFFLDPDVGPMSYGDNGLQYIGQDVFTTWHNTIDVTSFYPPHGVFYGRKQQVFWWLTTVDSALDANNHPVPNVVIKLQTTENRNGRRGWSTVAVGDRLAGAYCSIMFPKNIELAGSGDDLVNPYALVPWAGFKFTTYNGSDYNRLLRRLDITNFDDQIDTGDTDADYEVILASRAFPLASIIAQHEVLDAGILATAVAGTVTVELDKDFGKETLSRVADMTPAGSEEFVMVYLDSLSLAELLAVKVRFTDTDSHNPCAWRLHQFVAGATPGQDAGA